MSLAIDRDHQPLPDGREVESMSPSNTTTIFSKGLRRALLGAAAAVALAGCHHAIPRAFRAKDCNKPQPYDLARSIPPLKVPLGIDPPDTHGALRIPAYDEPAPPPRKLTAPCLDEPPSFLVPGTPGAPGGAGTGETKRVPSD
jgi:hypothetical protein